MFLISYFSYSQDQSEIQLANEYLLKGDKKKALELFRDLAKNESNTPFVYNNYLNVMLDLAAYDEAQGYLKKLSKRDPGNMQYELDMGFVMVKAGDLGKAEHHFNRIISENKQNAPRIKLMGDYFMSRSLMEYGIKAMNESRKAIGNDNLYCLELAMFYRIQGARIKWCRST